MPLALLAALACPAQAQKPGDEVPATHPARAILARPIVTTEAMILGTWPTVSPESAARTLSGEPLPYQVQISEADVTISSPGDPYGPRVFGIVRRRRVQSWVEYELRGQGGAYVLTAQLGLRAGGGRDAVFVLTPVAAGLRATRFVVPGSAMAAPPKDSIAATRTRPADGRPRRVREPKLSPVPVDGTTLLAAASRRVTPNYPASARSAGVEGIVVVEVTVDASGKVASAEAVSGPSHLRAESERAARGWEFRPFGHPVTGSISFRFAR